jgi:hypothetical protein
VTHEDDAERFEQGLDWYKAMTDFQKEHRAIQWQAARDVLELERKKALKVDWPDPTARKYT